MGEDAIIGACWGFIVWFAMNCIEAVYQGGRGERVTRADFTSALYFMAAGAALGVVLP